MTLDARVMKLLLLVSLQAARGFAEENPPESWPNFSGSELPEPPRQYARWRPPTTTLSSNLISSVSFLFQLGMSDPRGCEYRDYEAVVGSVWGYTNRVKAHGWILPRKKGEKQAFAVSWAGTIYPVLSVGEKADLKKDVRALIDADEPFRRQAATNQTNHFLYSRWDGIDREGTSISETNMTELKVVLLLRLGEAKLAQEYWNAWREPGIMNEGKEEANDPFRTLAFAWTRALFDRAICAHLRGDDNLALADCRRLAMVWPKLETEADRRGYEHARSYEQSRYQQKLPQFSFLEPTTDLLADEKRRVEAGPHRTVLQIGKDKFPDKPGRIRALIADLEEVNARQWDQPGGVALNWDPIVQAIVAEGEDAVEPLLDCLEKDERLTRSVEFGRDFLPDRRLIRVRWAAEAALNEILRVRFETKADYRRYWQKYRGEPMVERWYRVLLDDEAGRSQWLETAENILGRTDGTNTFLWGNAPRPSATNHYVLAGESLHAKTSPSVSELLIKRALLIAPTNYRSSEDCWTFRDAARMGLMLAEWDPESAAPGLAKIVQRCPALTTYPEREAWAFGCADAPEQFARLSVSMAELGDMSGLDLYANWIRDQKFKDLEGSLSDVLSPLGRFPNHPSIKEVSAKLFQTNNGDWVTGDYYSSLATRLVLNESYRALVLRALKDKTPTGTIVLKNGGRFEYESINKHGYESGILTPDSFAPKIGATVTYRVCDDVGHRLTRIEGLPRLELYWPEQKRDETLDVMIKFLTKNGANLKLTPATWMGPGYEE